MNKHNFIIWLTGFIDLNGGVPPTLTQWLIIKDHIKLVHEGAKGEEPYYLGHQNVYVSGVGNLSGALPANFHPYGSFHTSGPSMITC